MNSLEDLLQKDVLNERERRDLESRLADDPEAMEQYLAMIELEVLLGRDESVKAALLAVDQPDNVVALPGAHPAATEVSMPESVVKPSNLIPAVLKLAVAALLVLAAVIFFRNDQPEHGPSVVKVESANPVEYTADPPEKSPEDQYRETPLLAAGSLQRPPTPFQKTGSGPAEKISFNRDVRPILADNCYHCHGPDSASRKAELRLDKEDEARVVLASEPQDSELFLRLTDTDPDSMMPPPESHKKLTTEQIAIIRRWIMEGAEWEDHWAFITATRPAVGDSIDDFVAARLAEEGLDFSPEADRYTLLRRATLDATGLPPTPAEVTAFIEDESPDAYEKLVNRLLDSQAYAEHRARYWLDAARYGDTHGLHLDNRRDIWPYRDWVIQAFAHNMPFDQFTIEQLAGDLLPQPTQSQMVATGFNRCNVTTSEGGAIAEEFDVRYAVDRVSTTSTVWLGLTAGCAQCHDHKFDPLTMKEFYQMFAYFNNTTQPAMDKNIPDSPPVIRVYTSDDDKEREAVLRAQLGEISKKMKKIAVTEEAAINLWLADELAVGKWTKATHAGQIFSGREGDSPDLDLNAPFTVALRLKIPIEVKEEIIALEAGNYRVVINPDDGIGLELIDADGMTMGLKTIRRVKPGGTSGIVFTHDGSGQIEGLKLFLNGKENTSRFPNVYFDATDGRTTTFKGGQLKAAEYVSEFAIFDRNLTSGEILVIQGSGAIPGQLKKAVDKISEKEKTALTTAYLQRLSTEYQSMLVSQSKAEAELNTLLRKAPTTLVMGEKPEPAKAWILERGEYDQRRDEVTPGVPGFLPQPAEGVSQDRLGLAKWIVDPKNPLTARVTVNRMWQEVFGRGLVKTVEDFGTQGETASHPKLLDWLAVEFVESGWDVKEVYRKMLLSRTYRQSSALKPGDHERDPDNRLLARGARYRLDAEVLRDQALAASGLLIDRLGGPSVKPYQPDGIWQSVGYTNSNTQTFFQDFGKDEHRRTLYTFWKRTAPPPNMALFDAPNRESCTVRRERTNTPLQALVMMNDPQFVRAARYLAMRSLNERDNIEGRLDFMSMALRGRPMDTDEKSIVKSSLTQFRNAWESEDRGEDRAKGLLVDEVNPRFSPELADHSPIEVASWTMVASQLMNLDETVTKE